MGMWLLFNAGIKLNPLNLFCVILARTHTNQSSGSRILSLYKNISGIPEHLDLTGLHDYFPFAFPKVKSFIRRAFDHNHVLVATERIHPGKWHPYVIRRWLMHNYRIRLTYIYIFPHNFILPYLHFFVTTRQSCTYKQSTTDSEVRKVDCIRTLVTSYDNDS